MSRSHINMMTSHISCGILEVGSLLEDSAKNAWEIANKFYHPAHGAPEAYIMASDTPDSRSAHLMAHLRDQRFIKDLNNTMPVINPKSGSTICVYVAAVNHEVFKAWYKRETIARLKRRV